MMRRPRAAAMKSCRGVAVVFKAVEMSEGAAGPLAVVVEGTECSSNRHKLIPRAAEVQEEAS